MLAIASELPLLKKIGSWWAGVHTGEVQIFKQNPLLMIPLLAHIHTIWLIQLGELGWGISHEGLGFYPPHGLPLPGLDLQALLVHTLAGLLVPEDLAALPLVLGGSRGAIEAICEFSKDGAASGRAVMLGGRTHALSFVLGVAWIVGHQRAR